MCVERETVMGEGGVSAYSWSFGSATCFFGVVSSDDVGTELLT